MKKLLGIIVLGLLLSGNAYAESISCLGTNGGNITFQIKDNYIRTGVFNFKIRKQSNSYILAEKNEYTKNLIGFKKLRRSETISINKSNGTAVWMVYDFYKDKSKNEGYSYNYKNCN